MRNECTQRSFSFVTSAILRDIVTRMKYLHTAIEQRTVQSTINNIPELDVDTLIALELLFDILEQKVERLGLSHLSWSC